MGSGCRQSQRPGKVRDGPGFAAPITEGFSCLPGQLRVGRRHRREAEFGINLPRGRNPRGAPASLLKVPAEVAKAVSACGALVFHRHDAHEGRKGRAPRDALPPTGFPWVNGARAAEAGGQALAAASGAPLRGEISAARDRCKPLPAPLAGLRAHAGHGRMPKGTGIKRLHPHEKKRSLDLAAKQDPRKLRRSSPKDPARVAARQAQAGTPNEEDEFSGIPLTANGGAVNQLLHLSRAAPR